MRLPYPPGCGLALGVVLGVAACGDSASPTIPRGVPETREARWEQDVGVFARQLEERHADLFFRLPKPRFDAEVAELRARIPRISDTDVVVGMMRIAARVGDAHTTIDAFRSRGFRELPIRLERFTDGWFVTEASSEHEGLVGARLSRIGSVPIEAAVEAVAEVVPHENESWLRAQLPAFLIVPEILQAQGLVGDASRVELEVSGDGGATTTVSLEPSVPGAVGVSAPSPPRVPLYRSRVEENYWDTYLADSQTLYVQYRRASDGQGPESVAAFSARVLGFLDQNPVRALVIDLRSNAGGNSSLLGPLIEGLEARPEWSGGDALFVVVGKRTFSSALLNALSLAARTGAILIGEPTGGKPNHFGEVRSFHLPNSALRVSYSTRFFRVLPNDDPPSLEPDIRVAIASRDHFDGRDPVLERVLDFVGR